MKPFILALLILFASSNVLSKTVGHKDIAPAVKGFLKRSAEFKVDLKKLPKNHPDYPIKEILNALYFEKRGDYQEAIGLIEGLRERVNYLGMNKSISLGNRKLVVGTLGGFNTWRELAYIILGRSYYATNKFELAARALEGVPSSSTYYTLASLSLFWSYAGMSDYKSAEKVLGRLTSISSELSKRHMFEYKLQKAYSELFFKRYQNSFEVSGELLGDKELPDVFRPLVFKAYAEAGFYSWSSRFSSLGFEDSRGILGQVLKSSNSFSKRQCDSSCAFFIAEAWWNYASIHRVEDPIKYKKIIASSLKKADSAISPFVKAASLSKKTELSEEAFFLSVVLAWENKNYKDARVRSSLFEKLFPVGNYLVDSYQLLGDHFYDTKKFDKAVFYYRKLVNSGDYEKSTYGTYKASWAFYNKGRKWSGLRHLEQIVQGSLKNRDEADHYSIIKESKRDMLLFMAELMNNESAKKELEFLGFADLEKYMIFDQLALTYKKIGRFDQSSTLYRFLLDSYLSKKTTLSRPYAWFLELLDNSLRLRDFSSISSLSRQYLKQIIASNIKEGRKEFFDSVGKIVLTLHREARKTSDKRVVASTNELYLLLNKLDSDEFDSRVFYHGAQLFEQTGQYKLSVKWFMKAGESTGKFKEDAALSALYIAKKLSSRAGLNKEYAKYRPLVLNTSHWYIKKEVTKDQPHLAQVLYMENLIELKRYKEFVNFYYAVIEKYNETKQNINKLKVIESRLINRKDYKTTYELLIELLNKKGIDKFKKLHEHLKLVAQQSAFQIGLSTQEDSKVARDWYFKALHIPSDREVALRTWNNIFALHTKKMNLDWLNQDTKAFYEFLSGNEFSKLREVEQELATTSLKFLESLLYKEKLYLDSALVSSFYLNYTKSHGDVDRVYKAYLLLLTFGHSDKDKLVAHIDKFISSSQLSSAQRITLVKYWLYSGDIDRAYDLVTKKVSLSESREPVLLVLRDIFYFEEDLRDGVVKLLVKMKAQKSPIVSSLWNDINRTKYDFEELASVSFTEVEDDEKVKAEKLLTLVSEVDQLFAKRVKTAKVAIQDLAASNRMNAICSLSDARSKSLDQLIIIKKNALNFYKKWQDFNNGVAVKVGLFKGALEKERSSCNQHKDSFYRYLKADDNGVSSPFDGNTLRSSSYNKYKDIMKGTVSNLDNIWSLLDSNQLLAATVLLDHEVDKEANILGSGLVRLRLGDFNNALSLFASIKSDSAKLYHGITLKILGKSKLAKAKLGSVNIDTLTTFQRALLKEYL